jgi:hypothetical protein
LEVGGTVATRTDPVGDEEHLILESADRCLQIGAEKVPEPGDGLAGGFLLILAAGFGTEQQGSVHFELVHQLTPVAAAILISRMEVHTGHW